MSSLMIIVVDFTEQKQKKLIPFCFPKEIKDRKAHMQKKHRAGLFMETVPCHQSLPSGLSSIYVLSDIPYTL